MQSEIRKSPESDFPEINRFKDFKESGLLVSPDEVAIKILNEANIL